MTREEITDIFSQTYDRNKWKNLLFDLFNQAVFRDKVYDIKTTSAQTNVAKHIYFLGDVTLSSNQQIGFYEIHLKPGKQIARNRVQLRGLIRQELGEGITDGALAIFYDESQTEWRFSFISKWAEYSETVGFENKETHPKRYTYVLGPNQSTRTAVARFIKLIKNSKPSFKDLLEAFSVEKLSKEFFDYYEQHFEKFSKHTLLNYEQVFIANEHEEKAKADVRARNWVKLLLGRIIFLYFLQKKGWMGAKNNDYNGESDLDFLNNFWQSFPNNNHFYSKGLTELFFNTLNTKRSKDIFELTGTCVPYLNGGLFENHFQQGNQIDFPIDYFEDLFQFLNSYNFTIDESNPDDKDVGIDPEMLGMVFERLIEDNRASGTYYTPKAIVQYMVQESLIEYLTYKLEKVEGEALGNEIGKWVREKTFDDRLRKYSKTIDREIDNLKMCDPAIGSGAFPMGVLQELVNLKSFLYPMLDDFFEVKRKIIQNSIFGVDIDKGAVDIAQLRFWLSLMIEETKPKPLPNLELNIFQGNSLLQDDFESIRPWLGSNFANWTKLKLKLFDEHDVSRKKELRQNLYNYKLEALLKHDRGVQLSTDSNESELLDKSSLIKEAENNFLSTGDKRSFIWNLYYPEVMKEGGFDMVLSNPPYVRQEKIAYKNELKAYENYSGTTDLLVYFIEIGSKLAKNNGVLCYIVSDKFMRTGYGKKIRTYLAKHDLKKIIDFGDSPVFKATAYPSILLFQKRQATGNVQVANMKGFSDTSLTNQLSPHIFSIPQNNLDSNGWIINSKDAYKLLNKLSEIGTALGDFVNGRIYRGLVTGFNTAFDIDVKNYDLLTDRGTKYSDIVIPYVRGRDVGQYKEIANSRWLIHFPNGYTRRKFKTSDPLIAKDKMVQTYPQIMSHLSRYEERLRNRDDQGEFWWELRPCKYNHEFANEKIVYLKFQVKPTFTYDSGHTIVSDSNYIIPGLPEYYCGIFNSKLSWFVISNSCPPIRNGYQLIFNRFKNFPLLQVSKGIRNELNELVSKKLINDSTQLDYQINELVYQLYELNGHDIDIIEGRRSNYPGKKKIETSAFQPFQEKLLNQKRERRSETRAVVMARVIDLHSQSIFQETLHRTKGEKILHLIENHFDVDLGRIPWQDAAGPVDMVAINQTESFGQKEGYFSSNAVEFKPGKKRIDYQPGKKINVALVKYGKAVTNQKAVDNLIKEMLPLTRKQSECIATLDSILHAITPEELSFKTICKKFYDWHESKKAFSHDEIREGLKWLKKQKLLPTWIKVKIWEKRN